MKEKYDLRAQVFKNASHDSLHKLFLVNFSIPIFTKLPVHLVHFHLENQVEMENM